MARLTEKRLLKVPPQVLTSDGDYSGKLTIADTRVFVVGHLVFLTSSTQPPIRLKVKRIINKFTLFVGPDNKPIQERTDISAYLVADGASIEATEQNRPSVPEQDIERNTYDEEPLVARRVHLIDIYGDDAGSAISAVQSEEPCAKFIYGTALEVLFIVEYAPGAVVGDIVKETQFTYGPSLEVIRICTINRFATAGDLM